MANPVAVHDIVTVTVNPALDLSTSVAELRPFSKLRCSGGQRDAGGGGINVARVVNRLGGRAQAIFAAGGPIGRYLVERVADENVASVVVPIEGNTREDVTITETSSSRQFRFVLEGPQMTVAETERVLEACTSRLREGLFVVASGSLAPGVPEDFYARLATVARSRGARMLLDTSGAPLARALRAGVYLIKPNLREFRELTGEALPDRQASIAAARRLIACDAVQIVAISLAQDGALFVGRDFAFECRAPAVVPLSTVGAGDSFLGGLVSTLAAGRPRTDAFRLAVAAGTAALLSRGTGLCQVADIERLLPQIDLKAVPTDG